MSELRHMTAVYEHKLEPGGTFRRCVRCHLFLAEDGSPDARLYSKKALLRLANTPEELRCKHEPKQPLVAK